MPLGASRLSYLAFSQEVAIAARTEPAIIVTPFGNTEIVSTQSKFGGASAVFDGSGDYLDAAGPNLGAGEWTIEMFARFDSVAGVRVLYDDRESANTSTGTVLLYTNGTTLYFNSQQANRISGATLSANTWYHIAVVRDSSNDVKMYLDGTQIGSAWNDSSSYSQQDGDGWFGMNHQSPNNHMFDGYLDEIRFSNSARYTGAFTPTASAFTADDKTIFLLHCDTLGFGFNDDAPRTAITVTANGNAQVDTAQSQFGGASALFDGTDDYLTTAQSSNLSFATDFTIEGFARSASLGTIVSNRTVDATGFDVGTLTLERQSDDTLNLNLKDSANIVSSATSDNTWFHWAIVRSSGTITLYVDGTSEGTSSNTVTIGSGSHNQLQFGCLGNAVADYNGYIDEVRVSKVARYTGAFTPTASAFTNDYDTALLLHMDGADASTTFEDDNT